MSDGAVRRWSNLSIWRDAEGREVYAPWGRLSRTVYLIPTPERRDRIERANQRFAWGWLVFFVAFVVVTAPVALPGWLGLALGGAVLAHAAWLQARLARGLTPIPYVRPAD